MTQITSLQQIIPQTYVEMEIVHPTEGPMGKFIKVTSTDSAAYRNKQMEVARKYDALSVKKDIARILDDAAGLTATLIVGWDEEFCGPYSPSAALQLMQEPGFTWLREQIDEFAKDRRNFFR